MKKIISIIGIYLLISMVNGCDTFWSQNYDNMNMNLFTEYDFGTSDCEQFTNATWNKIRCCGAAENQLAGVITEPEYLPIVSKEFAVNLNASYFGTPVDYYMNFMIVNTKDLANNQIINYSSSKVLMAARFKGYPEILWYCNGTQKSSLAAKSNFGQNGNYLVRIYRNLGDNYIRLAWSANGSVWTSSGEACQIYDTTGFDDSSYAAVFSYNSISAANCVGINGMYSISKYEDYAEFLVRDSISGGIENCTITNTADYYGGIYPYQYTTDETGLSSTVTTQYGCSYSDEYGYYSSVAVETECPGYDLKMDDVLFYSKNDSSLLKIITVSSTTSSTTTSSTIPTRLQCFKFMDKNNGNPINNLSVNFEYIYNGLNYVDKDITDINGEIEYALKSCSYNLKVIKMPDYIEQYIFEEVRSDNDLYNEGFCNSMYVENSSTKNYNVTIMAFRDGALETGNNVIGLYSKCNTAITGFNCKHKITNIEYECQEEMQMRTNSITTQLFMPITETYFYVTSISDLDDNKCGIVKQTLTGNDSYTIPIYYTSSLPQREICFNMFNYSCNGLINANGTITASEFTTNTQLNKERICFNGSVNKEYTLNYNSINYISKEVKFTPLGMVTSIDICMEPKDITQSKFNISGNLKIERLNGDIELYNDNCRLILKRDGVRITSIDVENSNFTFSGITGKSNIVITAECGKYIESVSFWLSSKDITNKDIILEESNPQSVSNKFMFRVYEKDTYGDRDYINLANVKLTCDTISPSGNTDEDGIITFGGMSDNERCNYKVTKSTYTNSEGSIDYSKFGEYVDIELFKLTSLGCVLKGNTLIVNGSNREYKSGVLVNAVCNGNSVNSVSSGIGGYYEIAIPCNSQCIVTGDYLGIKKQVTITSGGTEAGGGGETFQNIEISLLNMGREQIKTGFMDFIYGLVPLFMSIIFLFVIAVFFGIAMFISKIAGGK